MSYAIYLRKSRADAEAEARGEGEISIGHTASISFCAHYRRFFSPPRGSMRPSLEIKKAAIAFSATAALSSCFRLLFMILLYRDVRATINYLP